MKLYGYFTLSTFIFLTFSCASTNFKTDCKPCDIDTVSRIANANKIDQREIKELFCIGQEDCSENVEFMEIFNEALFVSLNNNPQEFIKEFSRSKKRNFILKQLESPINDAIDLKKIINKVAQSSEGKDDARNQILKALRTALGKYDH